MHFVWKEEIGYPSIPGFIIVFSDNNCHFAVCTVYGQAQNWCCGQFQCCPASLSRRRQTGSLHCIYFKKSMQAVWNPMWLATTHPSAHVRRTGFGNCLWCFWKKLCKASWKSLRFLSVLQLVRVSVLSSCKGQRQKVMTKRWWWMDDRGKEPFRCLSQWADVI